MKKFIIYSIVTLLILGVLPACAMATTAESPIILGGSGDESCYGTLALPNGNLILSMATSGGLNDEAEYAGYTLKTWLLCLAPDGSTVWENIFGSDRKGGYTTVHYLALNDDGTFSGTVRYEIDQNNQYWQKLTFSCADGSILSEGEKVMDTMEEDQIFRNYYPCGNAMIEEDVHNFGTNCQPRVLRMLDAEGNELWQLDTAAIGLNHMAGWIATAQGTLLYGLNHDEITKNNHVIVLLVDAGGRVLWTYQAAGVDDGSLNDGIVDSSGRFVGLGSSRDGITDSGSPVGLKQLVICLDTATGNEFWIKATEQADRTLPTSHLAEIDGHYILCAVGNRFTTSVFEALDPDGNETNYWTTSIPEYGQLTPRFFLWNGELWTENMLDGSNSDVVLERVVIPDGQ